MVAGVDLVKGMGRAAGLRVVNVPGATGYLDANYEGKARCALDALRDRDFVLVHVEDTDEAAHNGDLDAKIEAVELARTVLGTMMAGLRT